MPSPRLRRGLIGVAVLAGGILVLTRVAVVMLPQDRLQERIAGEVAAVTGGRLEPGRVGIKVFGGLGVVLRGGRLQGTGAAWAQRDGAVKNVGTYAIAYDRLEVSLGLRALLQRRTEIGGLHLRGSTARVAIDGDPLQLRDFEFRVTGLSGNQRPGAAPADASPAESIPAALKFDLWVRAAEVVQRGTAWQRVEMAGAWAERRMQIASLSAGLGEGRVTATGLLDFNVDPWGTLQWEAQLVQLPAGPLLGAYLPDLGQKLECALDGDLAGRMKLRDEQIRRRSVTMKGEVRAGDGVLRAADWLEDVSPYLGSRQDLKTVRFSRLSHRFRVENGRYLIDLLEIDGHDTDWQADGWLGFEGGIGLNVGVRLPEGFTPNLGGMSFLAETMRDAEGRVNLGLKLSGRAAAPTIGLDFSRLGANR